MTNTNQQVVEVETRCTQMDWKVWFEKIDTFTPEQIDEMQSRGATTIDGGGESDNWVTEAVIRDRNEARAEFEAWDEGIITGGEMTWNAG